jgi:Mn2+/Fe2+ NRAMP family transporter
VSPSEPPPDRQDAAPGASPIRAPRSIGETLKYLGPGLIISANIVGSGELIVTTQLGAKAGFVLLWFIVSSCLVKVFVQVEFGRYSVSEGKTSLEALNQLPGPRAIVSWVLWLWAVMYVGTLFQISGMLGGIASLFAPRTSFWSHALACAIPATACAIILRRGRYGAVERAATLMVVLFTFGTIAAVWALRWTPYAVGLDDLRLGFSFKRPESFAIAFAAFGVTGVGASELIYYPYWCLEKGYGRFVGPRDDSPEWLARAQGWLRVMKLDAWLSMVIYTISTVCFYLLGAAILHAKGQELTNAQLVPALSGMYSEAFGPLGAEIFLIGAFVVLFSTVFVSTASNARLLVDGSVLFGILELPTPARRQRIVRDACIGLPLLSAVIYVGVGEPVRLILLGALGQALMLPFVGLTALHLRHRVTVPGLRPGAGWTLFLWVSVAAMAAVGLYQAGRHLGILA